MARGLTHENLPRGLMAQRKSPCVLTEEFVDGRTWTRTSNFLHVSRQPLSVCHQLHFQVENYILNVKREHSRWGARKIKERLARRFFGL